MKNLENISPVTRILIIIVLYVVIFAGSMTLLVVYFPAHEASALGELESRAYLVEKYNMGTMVGMPQVILEDEVRRTIDHNPELTEFIKVRFGISYDFDIYTKMRQFQGIVLQKVKDGYEFSFQDGRSCVITIYKGRVRMGKGKIVDEVTSRSQESVPC